MKKLSLLCMLFLLLLASACKKYPHPLTHPPKEITTTITDEGGKPLSSAHSGTIIQLTSDEAGGLAVIHAGLFYAADYGYKCIWKITIG